MATIKEIAKCANVSIGTVDRVLHNRGRVSKETKEKVRRIIEQVGYKPNVFAQQLRRSKKKFTFGILMPKPSQDSKYWQLPIRGMNKAQQELDAHGVKLHYFFYDKYSESSFGSIGKAVLNEKNDGLLIAPVISDIFHNFVKKIPKSIPYVFFDSFIPNSNYISYIGQDPFQSGILSGKLMHLLVGEKGSVVIVKFLPRDFHIEDRANGFQAYIREHTHLNVHTYEVDTHESIKVCKQVTNKIFNDIKYIKGIFVTNANTHQIASCVKTRNPSKKIFIIGFDLVEENIRYLNEGIIDFLISQMSEIQGYEGVNVLYRYVVLKERVMRQKMTQIDIITKENLNYYKS